MGCGKKTGRGKCGSYFMGRIVLCDECFAKYDAQYPQGWRGYPGDVCEHGNYTGGCGIDYMCPRCESGE